MDLGGGPEDILLFLVLFFRRDHRKRHSTDTIQRPHHEIR